MKPRDLELLPELASHRVAHIIVGGVAAILEGAPNPTLGLEVRALDLETLIETEKQAGATGTAPCCRSGSRHWRPERSADVRPMRRDAERSPP